MEHSEEQEPIEEANPEDVDDFCVDDVGDLKAHPMADCGQEIATLISAIGIIDETGAKPFIRGEYCYAAVARLEYLLRSEYLRNRRIRDEADDSDTDNNEMFAKCGEFMVVSKKLVPCFRSLMEDVIRYGLQSERSRPLLRICQCLMKMFCRFTFPLTADADQTEGYYIEYNKYHRFLEYQQCAKKALIENEVLHQIIILMSDCGLDLDPDDRSEIETDSLELTLCLLKNLLSIPNAIAYDDFLQDRAIMAFMEEKVMDIVVELTSNIHEETEKIQYLLMDVFYQYFRMEDADSMIQGFAQGNKSNNGNGGGSTASDKMIQQYQRSKAQRKSQLKRTRHNKWGGLSRVKLLNGASRVQSLGSHNMANENMHDRGKQAKFRPIKEKKKRLYLSSKVPRALIYVADNLLRRSFTPLMNTMMEKMSGRPEFELSQSSDCTKWFHLISLFLHFHRLRTRQLSAQKAKTNKLNFKTLKWYSPSSISCVLKQELIHFVISRVETLFECRKFKALRKEMNWSKLEEALHSYKEIVRCIYSMVQYGNDAVKMEGLRLFGWIFSDHRGPQLINDMIREYRAHQSTKLCLSYCIESVFYTIQLIEFMQKEGNALRVKTKKKKRKKKRKNRQNANHDPMAEDPDFEGEGGEEMKRETEDDVVEVAGMEIHDEDDDEMDDDEYEFMEKDFDFESFLRSYAANKVVAQYMYILEDYSLNSPKLNSYIVTLFNKLAFELNYAPLLFQLSYFLLFDEIMNDKVMAKEKDFNVVRKFAQKIIREFFKRVETNPVLFAEILFFKTLHAVDDINEPGSVRQALISKEEHERGKRERRANRRNQGDDEDDEEEEYLGDDAELDTTPWTEAEDDLLRNYYGTYSEQGNVLKILQDFLEAELQSERSESSIQHHLKQMGLWKGSKNKRRRNKNEAKKRLKPMEMSTNQRKSIIYHSVHRASYLMQLQRDENEEEEKEEEYTEDKMNRKCFEWIHRKLDKLCDVIREAIAVSSETLLDDVAIIPVESFGFDVMENRYLKDLLTKLGFLAPTKYTGTCWWRIPREFKTGDISVMVDLIKEALELPVDADLRNLCGSNQPHSEIAAFGDDQEIEDEVVRAQSQQLMESAASQNEQNNESTELSMERERESGRLQREKEEASDSDEEFQFDPIEPMAAGDADDDTESDRKKKKREKKKKRDRGDGEKRKSSKKRSKRKSRKRKRVESADEEESDGLGGEMELKRRKLTVNGKEDGNEEEEDFFGDLGGDDSDNQQDENRNGDDGPKETDTDVSMGSNQAMNTPQINKFRSLSLGENQNVLNAVAEEINDIDAEEEVVVPNKNTVKKRRRFVSDSDSD